MNELKQKLEYVLREIKHQGADDGSVSISQTSLTEASYEADKISMMRSVLSVDIGIKVIKDKRKGTISFNSLAEADIKNGITTALLAASSAEPDEAEGISPECLPEEFSHGPLEPDKEKLVDTLIAFTEAAKQKYPLISFEAVSTVHSVQEEVFGNTNNVRLQAHLGEYEVRMSFLAKDGERQSSFAGMGMSFADFDSPLIDNPIIDKQLMLTTKQIEVEPFAGGGTLDVVMTPGCYLNMLNMAQGVYMSDMPLIQKTSAWQDKLGEQVASSLVTWRTEPTSKTLVSWSPISGEGFVNTAQTFIEAGVLKSFALSHYGAKRTGLARATDNSSHFVIEPGKTPLATMIKEIKRGIYVDYFSAGSPNDSGLFTGVAKNCFLIENGEITKPVNEVMVATSVAEMLENIVAVSSEVENCGSSSVPYVLVRGIKVSGK